MSKLTQLKNAVCKFHKDEEGANTLEVVLIIALAAIVGVAIYQFGSKVVEWCGKKIKTLFDNSGEHTIGV